MRNERQMNQNEAAARIDAVYAYDMGCVDSGVKDDAFKAKVRERDDILEILQIVVRRCCDSPYTFEDVVSFVKWVQDPNGLGIGWL